MSEPQPYKLRAVTGVFNTVTFGVFGGRQQSASGEGQDAEDVANQASGAAQDTVDSAKVTPVAQSARCCSP